MVWVCTLSCPLPLQWGYCAPPSPIPTGRAGHPVSISFYCLLVPRSLQLSYKNIPEERRCLSSSWCHTWYLPHLPRALSCSFLLSPALSASSSGVSSFWILPVPSGWQRATCLGASVRRAPINFISTACVYLSLEARAEHITDSKGRQEPHKLMGSKPVDVSWKPTHSMTNVEQKSGL